LATPRSYPGHEGTDIGGKPNGLSIGTEVYAAARGVVVDTFSGCISGDIACGDAYGNYVLIEHTRMTDSNNTETWFTGYAHLQTVLVEPYTYIEEIGVPIALSGDTGLGGAHLHFEVRSAQQSQASNRINPWDDRFTSDGEGLWIGGNAHPMSAVEAHPPPTQLICQTGAGNNIRSGPGVAYDVVAKSIDQTDYEVFQIQSVDLDQAPGDWYHIRWQDSDMTGWMWSDLMNDCTSIATGTGQ
jgi:murein DD-endopeptidase MepM/ murein hydrolase activator NlpD